eukprot:GHVT01006333.1.p1 GENE.GHVT01006333.1~~GHVT01006333.1.p1  ORF type:complete len:604 (+),score=86.30 GHVT01006333.1:372-2183(+)
MLSSSQYIDVPGNATSPLASSHFSSPISSSSCPSRLPPRRKRRSFRQYYEGCYAKLGLSSADVDEVDGDDSSRSPDGTYASSAPSPSSSRSAAVAGQAAAPSSFSFRGARRTEEASQSPEEKRDVSAAATAAERVRAEFEKASETQARGRSALRSSPHDLPQSSRSDDRPLSSSPVAHSLPSNASNAFVTVKKLLKAIAPRDQVTCTITNNPSSIALPLLAPVSLSWTFARYFWDARRRASDRESKQASVQFVVPVALRPIECGSLAVAFGWPSEWGVGVAAEVLSKKWITAEMHFSAAPSDHQPSFDASLLIKSKAAAKRKGRKHTANKKKGLQRAPRESPDTPLTSNKNNCNMQTCSLVGRVRFGSHCSFGCRSYNEDRVAIEPFVSEFADSHTVPASFWAVYDGHNGEAAVEYVRRHLHLNVVKTKEFAQEQIPASIRRGFRLTDNNLREHLRGNALERGPDHHSPFSSGCTACACFLRGTMLFVANLGDSRGVLSRLGRAMPLTEDHTGRSAVEKARVKAAGGTFDDGGYLAGAVGVCRAFGDFDLKVGTKLRGLTWEPDVYVHQLKREDEFLLLASDGIYESLTSQEAVSAARAGLRQ